MPFIRKDGSRVTPAPQNVAPATPAPITTSPAEGEASAPNSAQRTATRSEVHSDKKQPTGDYEVGYCRPPVSGRIKPGEVRNPRGRAGAPGLTPTVLKAMRGMLLVRTADGERKVSRVEAIIMKLVEKALKGDNRAIEQSLLRYEQALADIARKVRDAAPQDMSAADRAILDAFLRTAGPRPDAGL